MKNIILLGFIGFFIIGLTSLNKIACQNEEKVVQFDPSSFLIEINTFKNITIKLNGTYDRKIAINFTYGDEDNIYNQTDLIEKLPTLFFEPNENGSKTLQINALKVGHLVVGAESNDLQIPLSNVFRLSVIHSNLVEVLIDIIGWIYFMAWSISFYPQVILNFRIKDISGLSLDFVSLNALGHSCYCIYNIALYWISTVQHEYFVIHPRGVNPVLLNDVLFSMHAVLLTFIAAVQCIIYRKEQHKVSIFSVGMLIVLISFLVISGVVCATTKLSILNYVYFFSYVKLFITIVKYIPQAYLNYKRKTTAGWSIWNALLDFTGGSFSILQMFLLAYNYNDWTSIFGSPTKFGLGFLSILFNIVFFFQHYVLYRQNRLPQGYDPIA